MTAQPAPAGRDSGSFPPAAGHLARQIERAAAEIRLLANRALIEFTCHTGRIVLERLYDGDVKRWRSRAGKDLSLRRLASLLGDGGHFSASRLSRAVGTYVLLDSLGGVAAWQHLSVSHVRLVLPLRPAVLQAELLRQAEKHRWRVEQFRREVERLRPARATEKLRRRSSRAVIARLRDLAVDPRLDGVRPEALDDEELAKLCGSLTVLRDRTDELLTRATRTRTARRETRAGAPR